MAELRNLSPSRYVLSIIERTEDKYKGNRVFLFLLKSLEIFIAVIRRQLVAIFSKDGY